MTGPREASPWPYIYALLGPGLHWCKPADELRAAVEQAERDGRPDAADHIRIILARRNAVAFDGA